MQKRSILTVVLVGTLLGVWGQFPVAHAQQAKAVADRKEAVVIQLTQKRVVASPPPRGRAAR